MGIIKPNYPDAYVNNIVSRISCGTCQYAKIVRTANITVGDYLRDDMTDCEKLYGSSIVLLNTEKGKVLFSKINEHIEFKPQNMDAVKNLLHFNPPSYPHKNRKIIFNKLRSIGYQKTADKYFCLYEPEVSLKSRMKKIISRMFRMLTNNLTSK